MREGVRERGKQVDTAVAEVTAITLLVDEADMPGEE